MINSVSFGSTYKVNLSENKGNITNYYSVMDYCDTMDVPHQQSFTRSFEESSNTIIAPDKMDKYLETYMINKGINFHKLDSERLMNPIFIKSRVKSAPKGKYKVDLDVERFEELIKRTESNYEHCKSNYDNYYKETLDTAIKSGNMIPAVTMSLIPIISDMPDFIKRYGTELIDENMLSVDFNMSEFTEDSSMYFAMKDAGMKKIPVYVDKDTFKLGEMFKLF